MTKASRKSAKSSSRKAKPKAKLGQPKIELDLEELEKLGNLQCTKDDVAAWFGCSLPTVKRRLREDLYREVWERGLGQGRVSLRKKQMALADKNATMAIFLGKQILGQRDVTAVEMDVTHKTAPEEMTEAELIERIRSRRSSRGNGADREVASEEEISTVH